MSKAIIAVAIVIVLVAGVVLYSQRGELTAIGDCSAGTKLELVGTGLTSTDIKVTFNITNPNSVPVTLTRIEYAVYGDGTELGDGVITQMVTIPANGLRFVDDTFTVSYGIAQSLWDKITGGTVDWDLIGTAYIDTPKGTQIIQVGA